MSYSITQRNSYKFTIHLKAMEKTNNIDDLKAIKSAYLDKIARSRPYDSFENDKLGVN